MIDREIPHYISPSSALNRTTQLGKNRVASVLVSHKSLYHSDHFNHPWIISELESWKPLFSEALQQGKIELYPVFEQLITSLLKKLDYVFSLSNDFKTQLRSSQVGDTPERDRFFSDKKKIGSLKESFLEQYIQNAVNEFLPFLETYQKEYQSLDLSSDFFSFLEKALDRYLSSLGEEFQKYVVEHCYALLPEEKKSDFNFHHLSSQRQVSLQEQQNTELLASIEKGILQGDNDIFLKGIVGLLSLSGYRFQSVEKFKKQLKKTFPDAFSKKVFLTALKKGNHLNLLSKGTHLYGIEIHKVLGWRMLVVGNQNGDLLIDGVYKQHDEYIKRMSKIG